MNTFIALHGNSGLIHHPYRYSDVSLDRYSNVAIPNHGTSEMIDDNLQTLRQIRRVYAKCLAVRNDVPVSIQYEYL
jgi:hypothetical protein